MKSLSLHQYYRNRKDQDLHILIVEDNEMDRILIERELKKSDLTFALEWAETRDEFNHKLTHFKPDIILCDFTMPQFGALEALGILRNQVNMTPLIIVTGTLTDKMAVECLEKGAADYVLKDKIVRLPSAIKMTLDLAWSRKEKEDAEDHLRENQKKLKIITDVLPVFVGYISKDFHFEFCNRINQEWFGKNVVGVHIEDVLGPRVYEQVKSELINSEPNKKLRFESELTETFAGPKFVEITLVPDIESREKPKGYACLITDVTDRKAYENKLKLAKEEADAANSAKSQFLANISHEMRTPLNAIMGLSEIILTEYRWTTEERSLVEKITRNAEHLKQVIDDVLDISKIEAGRIQVDLVQFSLDDLLKEISAALLPFAQEKHLDIEFKAAKPIPEMIYSDPIKIKHILINIVGNAIKFSQVGPIDVNISTDSEDNPTCLKFVVKDRGMGMTSEQSSKLFRPFTQVDNSMTRKFGGTGLGLAISKKFAQALEGDVKLLESKPKEGSTFQVSLKVGFVKHSAKIKDFLNLTTFNKHHIPALLEENKKLHVLLVEDSEDNQFLIRRFLEKEGVQVDVASDGQEGLEKALKGNYDLVLMDIQMPVLDGYNATSRLREQGYQKPILAFTAHAFQSEKDRCLKGGFDDFLVKPIKKTELMNSIYRFRPENLMH